MIVLETDAEVEMEVEREVQRRIALMGVTDLKEEQRKEEAEAREARLRSEARTAYAPSAVGS